MNEMRSYNTFAEHAHVGQPISQEQIAQELSKVFTWMVFGLLTSGLAAYSTTLYPEVYLSFMSKIQNPIIMILISLAPVFLIRYIYNKADLSPTGAASLFLIYSAFFGLFLGTIFFMYSLGSLFTTFLVASTTFASMAIYGYVTKKDLTRLGTLLGFAVIGLFLAFIINYFVGSPLMHMIYSGIGVIIFLGLTAYDTQAIKEQIIHSHSAHGFLPGKVIILGAFHLYINFINLFMMLLQFLGDRD